MRFASSSKNRVLFGALSEASALDQFRNAGRNFFEAVGGQDIKCNKEPSGGPPDNVTWPQQAAPQEWKTNLMEKTLPNKKALVHKSIEYFQQQPPNTVPWACARDKVKIAGENLKFSLIRLQTLLKFAEMNTLANPKMSFAHATVKWGLEQLPSIAGEVNTLIGKAEQIAGVKLKHIGVRPSSKEGLKYGGPKADQIEKAIKDIYKHDPEAMKKELAFLQQEKQFGQAAQEPAHETPQAATAAAPGVPAPTPGAPEPAPHEQPAPQAGAAPAPGPKAHDWKDLAPDAQKAAVDAATAHTQQGGAPAELPSKVHAAVADAHGVQSGHDVPAQAVAAAQQPPAEAPEPAPAPQAPATQATPGQIPLHMPPAPKDWQAQVQSQVAKQKTAPPPPEPTPQPAAPTPAPAAAPAISTTPELDKAAKHIAFAPGTGPGESSPEVNKIRELAIKAAQAAGGVDWDDFSKIEAPVQTQVSQDPQLVNKFSPKQVQSVVKDTLNLIFKSNNDTTPESLAAFAATVSKLGPSAQIPAVRAQILKDHGVWTTAPLAKEALKKAAKGVYTDPNIAASAPVPPMPSAPPPSAPVAVPAPPAPAPPQAAPIAPPVSPVAPQTPQQPSLLPPEVKQAPAPVFVPAPPVAPTPVSLAQKQVLKAHVKAWIKATGTAEGVPEKLKAEAAKDPSTAQLDEDALAKLASAAKAELLKPMLSPEEDAKAQEIAKQELKQPEFPAKGATPEGFQAKLMKAMGFWLPKSNGILTFAKVKAQNPDPVSFGSLPAAQQQSIQSQAKSTVISQAWSTSDPDSPDFKSQLKTNLKQLVGALGLALHEQDYDDIIQGHLSKSVNKSLEELTPDQSALVNGLAKSTVAKYGDAATPLALKNALKTHGFVHLSNEALKKAMEAAKGSMQPDMAGFLSAVKSILASVPKDQPILLSFSGVQNLVNMLAGQGKNPLLGDLATQFYIELNAVTHVELANLATAEAKKRLDEGAARQAIFARFDKYYGNGQTINKPIYVQQAESAIPEAGFFPQNYSKLSKKSPYEFVSAAFDEWYMMAQNVGAHPIPETFKSKIIKKFLDHPANLFHQVIAEVTGLPKTSTIQHVNATTWPILPDKPPFEQAVAKAVELSGGEGLPQGVVKGLSVSYNMPLAAVKGAAQIAYAKKLQPKPTILGGIGTAAKPAVAPVKVAPPAPTELKIGVKPMYGIYVDPGQLSPEQQAWLDYKTAEALGHHQATNPDATHTDNAAIVDKIASAFEDLPLHKTNSLTLDPSLVYASFQKINPTLPAMPVLAAPIVKPVESILGMSLVELEQFIDLEQPANAPEVPKSLAPVSFGGYHPKVGLDKDSEGFAWMFKPDPDSQSRVYSLSEIAGYRAQALLDLPRPNQAFIHTYQGQQGSIQRFIRNPQFGRGKKEDWTGASNSHIVKDLQKIGIFSWAVSNHDAHGDNIVKFKKVAPGDERFAGRLGPIDLGQSGKFIDTDELSINYNPNQKMGEAMPEATQMHRAYAHGEDVHLAPLTDPEILDMFDRLEAIPSNVWRKLWERYAEDSSQLPKTAKKLTAQQILDLFDKRRLSARADFAKFYREIVDARIAALANFAKKSGSAFDAASTKQALLTQLGIPQFETLLANKGLGPIAAKKIGAPVIPVAPEVPETDLYSLLDPIDQQRRDKNGMPTMAAIQKLGTLGLDMLVKGGVVRENRIWFWSLGGKPFAQFQLNPKVAKVVESKLPGHTVADKPAEEDAIDPNVSKVTHTNAEFFNNTKLETAMNLWATGAPSGISSKVTGTPNYVKIKYLHRALEKAQTWAASHDELIKAMGQHYLTEFARIGKKPMGKLNASLAMGEKVPLEPNDYALDDSLPLSERYIKKFAYTPPPKKKEKKKPAAATLDSFPACGEGVEPPCAEKFAYTPFPKAIAKSLKGEGSYEAELLDGHFSQFLSDPHHSHSFCKVPANAYRIKLGDGMNAYYVPRYTGKSDKASVQQVHFRKGMLRIEFDKDAPLDEKSMQKALDRLKVLGVNFEPATKEDAEVEYLRQMAWLRKLHGVGLTNPVPPPSDDMSNKEKIDYYINMFKKKPTAAMVSDKSGSLGHDPRFLPLMDQYGKVIGTSDTPNPAYKPIPIDVGGKYSYRRFDMSDAELENLKKNGYAFFLNAASDGVANMVLGGQVQSYERRLNRGVPLAGMSSSGDVKSGGSKECYWYFGMNPHGAVQVSPELVAYTHVYAHPNDSWGEKRPPGSAQHSGPQNRHGSLQAILQGVGEILPSDVVDLDRWIVKANVGADSFVGNIDLNDSKVPNGGYTIPKTSMTRDKIIERTLERLKSHGKKFYGGIQVFDDDWNPLVEGAVSAPAEPGGKKKKSTKAATGAKYVIERILH